MVMGNKAESGVAIAGLIFLGIGVLRFLQGDSWVVWLILGVLLGGVGAGRRLLKGRGN
jgi:hypothetical protein